MQRRRSEPKSETKFKNESRPPGLRANTLPAEKEASDNDISPSTLAIN